MSRMRRVVCGLMPLCAMPLLLSAALWPRALPARQAPAAAPARTVEIVRGLEHPWGLAFLPDGSMLVTERPGRLRRVDAQGRLSQPLAGLPEVAAAGQGGLLDIALSPGFAQDRLVYLSYAERDRSSSGTAIGRGRLSADASRLEDFEVLLRQEPKLSSGQHYGSRLAFHQGYLFATLGENNRRPTAQELDKLQGKIVRLNPDGTVPADNPFVGQPGARAEIWSYGHRNPQGLAVNPADGRLWEHEHGARGGDEVNIVQRGGNYGWPLATHGINYSGLPIPEARGETLEGGVEPVYWWQKSPAVSGMAFYDAQRYPQWKGSLFVGALAGQALIRLQLDGARVVAEERLLQDLGERIRDVRQSPDGQLYVLTDSGEGALLRVEPAP